jgi:hypothetical protein
MAWWILTTMMFMQAGGLQPGTGIVMGAIRTTEGRPAVGLRVAAVAIDDPDGNNLLSIGTTDSSGRYRLSNIPQGSYYIVAGRLARLTYFPAGSDASGAKQIVVEAARVVPGIDFTVPPDSVPIAPSLAKNRATEVLDFVMIGSETNLDRKLQAAAEISKGLSKFRGPAPPLPASDGSLRGQGEYAHGSCIHAKGSPCGSR